MRINHNIPALNAHRQLNKNSNVSSKVLERLSSGKKINRAADDAAGMAISEKMKAQIRGLSKAAQNTMDGISLIQTAEGAMNEVHSMLQRMRELAVQSSNGTVTDQDRKAIQDEINQLTSEVNRIANGTEFNTRKLLRGNEGPDSNTTVHRMSTGEPAIVSGAITANKDLTSKDLTIIMDGQERTVRLNNLDANASIEERLEALNNAIGDLGQAIITNGNNIEIRTTSIGGNSSIYVDGSAKADFGLDGIAAPVYGTAEINTGNAKATIYFDSLPEPGSSLVIGKDKVEFYDSSKGPYTGSNRPIDIFNSAATPSEYKTVKDIIDQISDMEFEGVKSASDMSGGTRVDSAITGTKTGRLIFEAEETGFKGHSVFVEGTPKEFVTNLQVGPNQGQGFRLTVGDIRSFKLGISASTPDGNTGVKGAAFYESMDVTDGLSASTIEHAINVSTEAYATSAITVYENAIVKVAEMRGSLGAIQNRLEYTAANLENTGENLTAALSRIEDTDMALEMSEFTKYNILIQAGTSMLAQANQRPQTVLQLLNS